MKKTKRPAKAKRLFTSDIIEDVILEITSFMQDKELSWMFENCFPNTLDTTVHYQEKNENPSAYVITGDIHAMWLRDSAAQIWPYLQFVNDDDVLDKLFQGVIHKQAEEIQRLKDEIARLKNQPPRPKIRPSRLGKKKKAQQTMRRDLGPYRETSLIGGIRLWPSKKNTTRSKLSLIWVRRRDTFSMTKSTTCYRPKSARLKSSMSFSNSSAASSVGS